PAPALLADGWAKPYLEFAPLLHYPWLKSVTQKVELLIPHLEGRLAFLVAATIDNLRLLLVEFQFAVAEPCLYLFQQPQRFLDIAAMNDYIVCIPLKGCVRAFFGYPLIKHNIHEDVEI